MKLRAERKAGELLGQLERGRGGEPSHSFQPGTSVSEYRTVLTESNVATTTAHRWQTVAEFIGQTFNGESEFVHRQSVLALCHLHFSTSPDAAMMEHDAVPSFWLWFSPPVILAKCRTSSFFVPGWNILMSPK